MSDILFTKNHGIARITINHPQVKNAFTTAICGDMAQIIIELATACRRHGA